MLEEIAKKGKSYGCDDLKIVLIENEENIISVRNGQTEKIQHSASRSLAIDIYIDGRNGFVYTSHLDPEAIDHLLRQGIESTRLLTPDPSRSLATPSRYYRGGAPDLEVYDPQLQTVTPEQKLTLAQRCNRALADHDSRIISVETSYSDHSHKATYYITNGFTASEQSTRVNLSTTVTMDGVDGQHPMDGWGETRIRYADMPLGGISERALERTVRKIGQRPTQSGRYDMLVEWPVADHLLAPLLSAMQGAAIQQQMSFLGDKLGQQVASPLLHLVDDPLTPGRRGASYFDFDGVATERRILFDHGRLSTLFIDESYGRKLSMAPTTLGAHHLELTPGALTLEQLIVQSTHTILVTDFNGGNCDPATGNFSYGIEGFLIEDGIIVQPISGMNITGNMLQLWQNLVAVSSDFCPHEVDFIPSLKYSNVEFSGL